MTRKEVTKKGNKVKKAFTMIELVFVIVVIGILAAVIIPNTRTNPVQEAAIKLTADIRYVQHLAQVDDKYGTANDWYKNRWQIAFSGTQYSLVSDNNTTYAKDPMNTSNNLKDIDLGAKYGIISINYTGGCAGENLFAFDHIGRPLMGNLNLSTGAYTNINLLTNTCNIEISDGTESADITIEPETGYVRIL